ncbi:hypothetical protein VNO78_11664 [Psophocarpus tetragonolobus]|uniref:Uncharacterized protein n=1 Tax=Psophocarpus tetragonolobus TaxID=3891 RepID=A0AAN9SMT4_PSOTE
MTTAKAPLPLCSSKIFHNIECRASPATETLGFWRIYGIKVLRGRSKPIKARKNVDASLVNDWFKPIMAKEDFDTEDCATALSRMAMKDYKKFPRLRENGRSPNKKKDQTLNQSRSPRVMIMILQDDAM